MAEEESKTTKSAAEGEKPAPAKKSSQEERRLTRREFNWLALGWTFFAAAAGAGLTAMGRFMFPNVLTEPPSTFKVGFPSPTSPSVSSTLRFKEGFQVWIVRNEEGIYALSTICTHLGCTPNWLEAENKFKCPCHGSGFYMTGINFEGPAPRPLERHRIVLAEDGQVLIDKSRIYKQEAGPVGRPRVVPESRLISGTSSN